MMKPLLHLWAVLPFSLTVACGGPEPSPIFADKAEPALLAATALSSMDSVTVSMSSTTPLTLTAKLAYAEDRFSKISSPLQGRVIDVRVKLGDHVNAGDILLVMDSPSITAAYTDYAKEIAELGLAKRNYKLAKDLYELHALPLKEYKQAENDLRREHAEFRQAKERLLSLRVPAAELEKPPTQQTIVSRFELKSPLAGTVVDRDVTPGQLVGNDINQVLFTVADLDTLQVIADVYEKDLGVLEVGQLGHVRVDAYADLDFPATITAIGDVVDAMTRTITVRAWVHNPTRRLKPGMFARLTIPIEGQESIVIPSDTVTEGGPHAFVYVELSPGRYDKRAIKVERLDQDRLRVVTGLAAGERVVKSGVHAKALGY